MITAICPVLNEKEYIEELLRFFIQAQPDEKELLLIDGGSTDGTIDVIKDWCEKFNNIRLLHNPQKYVPFALNLGIINSLGDPIIRLDGHTKYSNNYFITVIDTFNKTGADIVGGPMNAVGRTNFQKAVAFTTSTIFGVGDSKIHQISYEGESDHVYLGAWKRKLFFEIGYFDEKLKRNQDDEFHYRAKSMGKKIYLNPEIKSTYYPRNTFSSLIKQYFQYGFYKPIVLKKIRSEIKFRHVIPSIFSLYILAVPLSLISKYFLIPLFVYLIADLYFSVQSENKIILILYSYLIYPSIHLSYGLGFLIGIIRALRESSSDKQ